MTLIDSSQLAFPILLEPNNFTDHLWGGEWIPRFKGLTGFPGPIGESWEFSLRSERPTHVRLKNGVRLSLVELVRQFPSEILGARFAQPGSSTSPLLIKLIDAADDLSLQVHPSDEQVSGESKDGGKSEAWVILETGEKEEGGNIYLGFDLQKRQDYSSPAEFESAFFDALNQANAMGPSQNPEVRAKAERLVLPFLNKIKVRPGEVYEVRPGTLHVIGRGVRLYEIQQSSDLTYRVWDWNRPDVKKLKEGNTELRELHLEKARGVLNFKAVPPDHFRLAPAPLPFQGDVREEVLIVEATKKFAAHRITFGRRGSEITLSTNNQFQVLTVIKGSIDVGVNVLQGHSVLIPACLGSVLIKSSAEKTEVIRGYIPI